MISFRFMAVVIAYLFIIHTISVVARYTAAEVNAYNRDHGHFWYATDQAEPVDMQYMPVMSVQQEEKVMIDSLPESLKSDMRSAYSGFGGDEYQMRRSRREYPESFMVNEECITPPIAQRGCGSCWYVIFDVTEW